MAKSRKPRRYNDDKAGMKTGLWVRVRPSGRVQARFVNMRIRRMWELKQKESPDTPRTIWRCIRKGKDFAVELEMMIRDVESHLFDADAALHWLRIPSDDAKNYGFTPGLTPWTVLEAKTVGGNDRFDALDGSVWSCDGELSWQTATTWPKLSGEGIIEPDVDAMFLGDPPDTFEAPDWMADKVRADRERVAAEMDAAKAETAPAKTEPAPAKVEAPAPEPAPATEPVAQVTPTTEPAPKAARKPVPKAATAPTAEPVAEGTAEPAPTASTPAKAGVVQATVPAMIPAKDIPQLQKYGRKQWRYFRDAKGHKVVYVAWDGKTLTIVWRDWYQHDDTALERTVRDYAAGLGLSLAA